MAGCVSHHRTIAWEWHSTLFSCSRTCTHGQVANSRAWQSSGAWAGRDQRLGTLCHGSAWDRCSV